MLKYGAISLFAFAIAACAFAEEEPAKESSTQKTVITPLTAFTGKISKNKVRMRSGPSLDGAIIREMNKGELLLVLGETDEFYVVQPPADVKGYIFRTFVLDNKVEGNRVNVRLAPNTEAPVVAQMNSGDPADGTISSLNNKWLEINLPESTRFFVAKEYLEKVGDKNYMTRMAERRDEVNRLLQSTYALSQQELHKQFPDIKLERITDNYQKIATDFSDFPEQAARAKELLEQVKDNYLQMKIAYLEAKADARVATAAPSREQPVEQAQTTHKPEGFPTLPVMAQDPTEKMNAWAPVELAYYEAWKENNPGSLQDFYAAERKNSITLSGVIEPYARAVKNKPGDYVLLDPNTQLPIAFLYSTNVKLHEKLGQKITLEAVERNNNHFAYPAYYVLSLQ